MHSRSKDFSVKVLDGPRDCEVESGVPMVMYRFICTDPRGAGNKVSVIMTRQLDLQQPELALVLAEQLRSMLTEGVRLSEMYAYKNGLLKVRHN